MEIRLAGITEESLVDGPGLRTVIWTQGCPHGCPGCHNAHTQEVSGGELVNLERVFAKIDHSLLAQGITLSGGEPFLQPEACRELARYAKGKGLDVWCYTGYTLEQLLKMAEKQPGIGELLQSIDVLVDGPFIQEQKRLDLVFRGSANQRIINVQETLRVGEPALV
ncbi:MAG TPA: anaerobic ribonucleoside-triphosphate reductase activating protein [Bacillota bacterium]|nr:anaerobic ribonucleoside-triphosphate reductase activating protein [Bacillota bacterium]